MLAMVSFEVEFPSRVSFEVGAVEFTSTSDSVEFVSISVWFEPGISVSLTGTTSTSTSKTGLSYPAQNSEKKNYSAVLFDSAISKQLKHF